MAYFFLLILFFCLLLAREYINLPAIRKFKVEINGLIFIPFVLLLYIFKGISYLLAFVLPPGLTFVAYEEIMRYLVFPFWSGFFEFLLILLLLIISYAFVLYIFSIYLRIFEKIARLKVPEFSIFIRPFSPRKVGILIFLIILLLFWEYFPRGETTCARFESGKYTEEQAETYLRAYGERVGVRIHNIYGLKYECSLEPWRKKVEKEIN